VKLLIGTFLFSVASALIPVLNVEAYLAVVAAKAAEFSDWELALVAGLGQTAGKVVWYYVGLNSLKLRWIQRKMATQKWADSYERWHRRIHGRPVVAGLITFTSSVTGFPPLAVIAVLAGTLRMSFPVFLATVLAGRTIRFWAVLAGVGLLFGH
jgi:membrane protein YqaA with SNARE-associated domain